jgi:hypothetical protein
VAPRRNMSGTLAEALLRSKPVALQSKQDEGLSKSEIEDALHQLGKLVDRTKVMYEQYFMGIQKTPPAQLHKNIERQIRELTKLQIRNTGLRYRFTMITQKFGSYNSYWRRIMREIEQGRYVRDVRRANRRAMSKGEDLPEEMLQAMPKRIRDRILRDREALQKRAEREGSRPSADDQTVREPKRKNVHTVDMADAEAILSGDVDLDQMFAAITSEVGAETKAPKPVATLDSEVDNLFDTMTTKAATPTRAKPAAARPGAVGRPAVGRPVATPRQTPTPPAPRRPASRGAIPPPGMDEKQGRELFDRYVKAKRLVGDNTAGMSYDKLMRSLSKKTPSIMEKHKAKGVDFNVVVRGDKVILKAKPKK